MIRDYGFKIIKNVFLSLNLESIDLSFHSTMNIKDDGYLNLNEIIKNSTNLKKLYLNNNLISDKSFKNIKECLISHKTLTYLDLSYVVLNDNNTKGSNILNEIFSKNSIINTLNIKRIRTNLDVLFNEGFIYLKNLELCCKYLYFNNRFGYF
jgi:hypothetical protein